MTVRLWEFKNEPYADFSKPENAAAMRDAIALVRSEFGREYDLRIGGESFRTGDLLKSVNPSKPSEIGRAPSQGHRRALAVRRIASGRRVLPRVEPHAGRTRASKCSQRAAAILRRRKFEFDAWLVFEAGKTLAGSRGRRLRGHRLLRLLRAADAEAALRPEPLVQLPGERDDTALPSARRRRHHSALEFPAGHPGRA